MLGVMEFLTPVCLALLPALVIVAALKDLTTMKIPNWISLALLAGFFPAALAVGMAPIDMAVHLGIGLLALIVGAAMFATRLLGGGDAKLMAACAVWMGFAGSGMFVLWTAVMGGAFCLMLIVARSQLSVFAMRGPGWVATLLEPKGDIPYGVAIAAGALMAYPASPLLAAFIAG